MRAFFMAVAISLASFLIGVAGDLSGPVITAQASQQQVYAVRIALPPLQPAAFATATAEAATPRRGAIGRPVAHVEPTAAAPILVSAVSYLVPVKAPRPLKDVPRVAKPAFADAPVKALAA